MALFTHLYTLCCECPWYFDSFFRRRLCLFPLDALTHHSRLHATVTPHGHESPRLEDRDVE